MTDREAIRERIQEQLAAAERASERSLALAGEVAELTGDAISGDGEVRVRVDHRGLVEEIQLTERAFALTPEELRDVILATADVAIRDLQEQAEPLQASLGPAVDPSDTTVMDELDRLLTGTPQGRTGDE